jgi:type II secretory pathway pseudopilin PulG
MLRPLATRLIPRRRKGATLFEVLLVLLAIAGIIAAATLVFSQTGSRQKLNDAQTQLNTLISGTRQYFAGFGTYENLSNGVAVNAGIVPRSMIPQPPAAGSAAADTIPLRNPWSGEVRIQPAQVVAPNDAFTITFGGLPNDICRNLLTINTSAAPGAIARIEANGTAVFTEGATQLTAANVNQACGASNANQIVWTIR